MGGESFDNYCRYFGPSNELLDNLQENKKKLA